MAQAFQQDDLNKLEEQVRGIKTHRETDTERTGGGLHEWVGWLGAIRVTMVYRGREHLSVRCPILPSRMDRTHPPSLADVCF